MAVVYGWLAGMFIYRELKISHLFQVFARSGITTAVVMIIIANASLFGWIITREQLPQKVASLFAAVSNSAFIFLLLVGTVFESSAALIILNTPFAADCLPVWYRSYALRHHYYLQGMVTPPLGVNSICHMQYCRYSY